MKSRPPNKAQQSIANARACTACNGSGEVKSKDGPRPCPRCRGRGSSPAYLTK